MKKTAFLLLAAVLSFSLCACSRNPQAGHDNTQKIQQQIMQDVSDELSPEMSAEEKIAVVSEKFAAISKGCAAFLQVEINPAFELYLTVDESIHEFRVLGARPLNEDAETLFQNLSVSHMTLWDALRSICNAAQEGGYLTANSNMQVAYHGQLKNCSVDAQEIIPIILDEYQKEKQFSFSYEATYTEVRMSLTVDESPYDTVEKDADGNVIRTVQTTYTEDHRVETVETCLYGQNGEVLSRLIENPILGETYEESYENGYLVKTVVAGPWGTNTETFDANGNKTSEIHYNAAEDSYEEYDYINGVLVKAHHHGPGREHIKLYDENGAMISEIQEETADDYYAEKYYTNGVLTKAYYRGSGQENTQTYDENGNMLSSIVDNQETGHYSAHTYDASGNMTSQIINDPEQNSYSETYWTYYEDGSLASYIHKRTDDYYTQGYYKEEQYYRSGVVSMSYQVSQYGDNKFYYDESGNPTRYEGKNNFGEWVEITY